MFTFLEQRPEVALPLADALAKKHTAIIRELGTTVFKVVTIGDEQYELVSHQRKIQVRLK